MSVPHPSGCFRLRYDMDGSSPPDKALRKPRTNRWLLTAGLVAAAGVVALTACAPASPGSAGPLFPAAGTTTAAETAADSLAQPAATFSWFRAGAAPVGWHATELPDGTAVLAYPSGAVPVEADAGTVAAGIPDPSGQLLVYLNATGQQGSESPANWPTFRTDHLSDENASPATLEATAEGLPFRGGTGSCILDSYTTRIAAHHYREIACLVTGSRATTVIVAAAPAEHWDQYRGVLEQAVEAYIAR